MRKAENDGGQRVFGGYHADAGCLAAETDRRIVEQECRRRTRTRTRTRRSLFGGLIAESAIITCDGRFRSARGGDLSVRVGKPMMSRQVEWKQSSGD